MAQECTGRYQLNAPSHSPGSGTPPGYDPNASAPRAVEQQQPYPPVFHTLNGPPPIDSGPFSQHAMNRGPYPTDRLVFRPSTLPGPPPPVMAPVPISDQPRPQLGEMDNSYTVPDKVKHPFPPAAAKHPPPTPEKVENMERSFKVSKNLSRRTRVGQTIIWDRHKTVEEKLGEVNMLLTKMPQGEEDWVAFAPRTNNDVDNLFGRLTLQKFPRARRATMGYKELLEAYEELVTQVPSYEKQMFKVISVGLSRIATKLGPMRTKEVFEIMDGTASELRWTRVAVSRIIDACDILATFGLGERAYELSMRREYIGGLNSYTWLTPPTGDKLPSTVGRFTREHFALLIALMKLHPEKIYKPMQSLPSGKLRIPTVLFELLGGEERKIKEDRGERAMTIADIAGVLEVPSEQPNTCWLDPSRGKAIPVLRPLRPDDVAKVLRAARLQPETRRLKPSSLQELINWRVLDLTEAMYDR
jgi:hypothetical protein